MTNTRDAADVIHHSTKHATPALQPLVSFRRRARPTKRVRTWLSAPVPHRVRVSQRVTAREATHHPATVGTKTDAEPGVPIQRVPTPN